TRLWLCVVAAMTIEACRGASAVPTAPDLGSFAPGDVLAVEVGCPAVLTGEQSACVALAHNRQGQVRILWSEPTWSSTRPEVATVEALGAVTARSASVGSCSLQLQTADCSCRPPVAACNG